MTIYKQLIREAQKAHDDYVAACTVGETGTIRIEGRDLHLIGDMHVARDALVTAARSLVDADPVGELTVA